MRAFSGNFFTDQAQANTHSMDMHIDWQGRLLTAKEQHAGSGFRTNAIKTAEPGSCLLDWQLTQKVQVETTTLLRDLAHNTLQTGCLHFRPVDVLNGVLNFGSGCVAYRFPGAENA